MGLVKELGVLGIASRLERLSEKLKKGAELFYLEHHGDIKYRLYPVIFVLHRKGIISVGELASELSYAHPYIIQLLREMESEKLIKSVLDKKDGRRRLISLAPKGLALAEKIRPYVKYFEKALLQLMNTSTSLMKAIEEVEERLEERSFYMRVKKVMEKETITPRHAVSNVK